MGGRFKGQTDCITGIWSRVRCFLDHTESVCMLIIEFMSMDLHLVLV